MSSIFDLKQQISELPSANLGLEDLHYEQVPPLRGISGNAFHQGEIEYKFTVPRGKWWIPAKSYFRPRITISNADTNRTQLSQSAGIGPSMGMVSSLFQSARFEINNVEVSRTSNNEMGQLDALETRLSKSGAWMNGIGSTTNFWESSLAKRIAKISIEPNFELNSVGGERVTSLEMGFNDDTTITILGTTGLVTFIGTDLPDVSTKFKAGDILEILAILLEGGTQRFKIRSIPSAATVQLDHIDADFDFGPSDIDFARIRKVEMGAHQLEMNWQPPLSIFKLDHALPQGNYRIILSPETSPKYKIQAVESLTSKVAAANETVVVADGFDVNVGSMNFYYLTVRSSTVIDNGQYILDLDETIVNRKQLSAGTLGEEVTFEISPSTYALSIMLQDTRIGSNTRFSSTKFKVNNGDELRLNSLQVRYGGENKPKTQASWTFNDELSVFGTADNARDEMQQRYVDTYLYSGRYFSDAGPETLAEWRERGPVYFFSWPKPGSDTSTSVVVSLGFRKTISNANCILAHHKKRVAIIQIKNGEVVDVQVHEG